MIVCNYVPKVHVCHKFTYKYASVFVAFVKLTLTEFKLVAWRRERLLKYLEEEV